MHMAFKGSLAHKDPRAGIAQCDGEPKFDGPTKGLPFIETAR